MFAETAGRTFEILLAPLKAVVTVDKVDEDEAVKVYDLHSPLFNLMSADLHNVVHIQ